VTATTRQERLHRLDALERARAAAAAVLDPEVPVLTIEELGVLRDVSLGDDGAVVVTVTPTYSGCPAMEVIEADVEQAVRNAGFSDVQVRRVLSPAWTTDAMTDAGRAKLRDYGIAPPARIGGPPGPGGDRGPVLVALSVRCPRCGSSDTSELSRFGSTACKALWRCNACREPFDHFKAI